MDKLNNAVNQLASALSFLDQCRESPKQATETGAMCDAKQWLEEAARQLVAIHSEISIQQMDDETSAILASALISRCKESNV